MIEIQDIFSAYADEYRNTHAMSLEQQKVFSAIVNCRTAALGGHMDVCTGCGFSRPSYNSCRNRHCPKCQTLAKERWIENQSFDLLNTHYFHVVFTIPAELNALVYSNQKSLYALLLQCAAETLKQLAADKKFLGATIGCTEVLHTWGQNLMFHPHVHCIVPGGGLSETGRWIPSKKKFFLPVKVMSRLFRGKFLALLKNETLSFHGSSARFFDAEQLRSLIDSCYQKEWVVYCKPPFRDPSSVIQYLGRYTHRVAISNNRIRKMENGYVTFNWRDYEDHRKQKLMTVTACEFIRRFLLHVLPKGFMKIRHFGILGNRNKTKKLLLCKKLTHTPVIPKERLAPLELLKKLTGKDIAKCPACGMTLNRYSTNLAPPLAA